MPVKKQQLEPDMEQQTGAKLGKEYIKAIYCHPAYLTYMQCTSFEIPNCMKPNQDFREISNGNLLSLLGNSNRSSNLSQCMGSHRVRHD